VGGRVVVGAAAAASTTVPMTTALRIHNQASDLGLATV
jgi:hypothetical protein